MTKGIIPHPFHKLAISAPIPIIQHNARNPSQQNKTRKIHRIQRLKCINAVQVGTMWVPNRKSRVSVTLFKNYCLFIKAKGC